MDLVSLMVVFLTIASTLFAVYIVKRCYHVVRKEDICYCKHWRGLYKRRSTTQMSSEVLFGQNYQIAEAFRHLQISVDKLCCFSSLGVVSAEKILRYAFELVADKNALKDLTDSTVAREYTFVAGCLKNASPLMAPKINPGRAFVKTFCQNIKSNNLLCYSTIEEAHSCIETYEWTIRKMITGVRKNVKLIEKIPENRVNQEIIKNMKHICCSFEYGLKTYSDDVKTDLFNLLNQAGIKKTISLHTEMVGAGYKGCIEMVSRVSLVDKKHCIYDKFVKPINPVADYRTFTGGLNDLSDAEDFTTVQREVASLIHNRILVGYDLEKDLKVLNLEHPEEDIRDTAFYPPFRKVQQQKPTLKMLSKAHLDRKIQDTQPSSVEDAKAAKDLYLKFAEQWEEMTQFIGHKSIEGEQKKGEGETKVASQWPSHVFRAGGSRRPQDIDPWKLLLHFKQQGIIFKNSK